MLPDLPFHNAIAPSGPGSLSRIHDHAQLGTQHSVGILCVINPKQTYLTNNTQYSQDTDNDAPGEIQNRNPTKRAAGSPCLRPASNGIGNGIL